VLRKKLSNLVNNNNRNNNNKTDFLVLARKLWKTLGLHSVSNKYNMYNDKLIRPECRGTA
jgi:hypothetical protein